MGPGSLDMRKCNSLSERHLHRTGLRMIGCACTMLGGAIAANVVGIVS